MVDHIKIMVVMSFISVAFMVLKLKVLKVFSTNSASMKKYTFFFHRSKGVFLKLAFLLKRAVPKLILLYGYIWGPIYSWKSENIGRNQNFYKNLFL